MKRYINKIEFEKTTIIDIDRNKNLIKVFVSWTDGERKIETFDTKYDANKWVKDLLK